MLLAARSLVAAQQAIPLTEGADLKVEARVVELTVLVRDGDGKLARDLTKDDFNVYQDDALQKVRYFNRDDDLPLTIGLMVDTSGSLRKYAEEERRASLTFLQSMITRPEDRVFVERFDTEAYLLQKMDSKRDQLEAALGHLADSMQPPTQRGRTTVLYDAIRGTLTQIMGQERGRRALVILTDGVDEGSETDANQVVLNAEYQDTVIYTVLYNNNFLGRSMMKSISNETGGRLFIVGADWPIDRIYREIESELRSQYRLGFTPPPSAPKLYHHLEVKVRKKHVTVQTRKGYFSPRS